MSNANIAKALRDRQSINLKTKETKPDPMSALAAQRIERLEEENKALKAMVREAIINMDIREGDWFQKSDEHKLRRVIKATFETLFSKAMAVHRLRNFWD